MRAEVSLEIFPGNLFPPVALGREQAPGHSPSLCLTLIGDLLYVGKYEIRGFEVICVFSLIKEGCKNLWAMVRTVQPANASWSTIILIISDNFLRKLKIIL